MKLSRKKSSRNLPDPSQRKISSYFQTSPSVGSRPVLCSKNKFVETAGKNANENVDDCVIVKDGEPAACAVNRTPTRDNGLSSGDQFIISPSPECKVKKSSRLFVSNKRKLTQSPPSKVNSYKASNKLSLKLKMTAEVSLSKRLFTNLELETSQPASVSNVPMGDFIQSSCNAMPNVVTEPLTDELKELNMEDEVADRDTDKDDPQKSSDNEVCFNRDLKDELDQPITTESLDVEELEDIFSFNNYRYHVVKVSRDFETASTTLTVHSVPRGLERRCVLKGFWFDTTVKEGDIVNVLAEFDATESAIVDNYSGLIVVNPDILISGTTVVASVFCQRKAIFSEWFREVDAGDYSRVVGNIIHELFQQSLVDIDDCKQLTLGVLKQNLFNIISREKILLEMFRYKDKFVGSDIMMEFKHFLNEILAWTNKYVVKNGADINGESRDIKVVKIHDIEETIWSPRLGLKGKVDVTTEVKLHSRGKSPSNVVLPLELKTGKASFSSEHRGQVMLYSMLLSERRTNPEGGLLLYLKDSKMEEIKDDFKCQQGLVQMRNEIASHLARPVSRNVLDSASQPFVLAQLPQPVCDARFCEKCPYLTTCAIYQRTNNYGEGFSISSAPNEFFFQSIIHLNEDDMKYFVLWCSCLFLESSTDDDKGLETKSVWCTSGQYREKKGAAYTKLLIVNYDGRTNNMHRFQRKFGDQFEVTKGMSVSQYVIISQEEPLILAVAAGYVMEITSEYVEVRLDKDLYKRENNSKVIYRIDSISIKSSWKTCLGNVARLMENSDTSQRLRNIIVHHRLPTFLAQLPKSVILAVKPILRHLNKGQQAAVFKALMCNDYLLIKGMPGAGKTATIVALVQVLVSLGRTVLITSHTHSAVDNILLKLVEKGVDFLRLGNINRVKPELYKYTIDHVLKNCKSIKDLDSVVNSKMVVATTCLGTGHVIFSQRNNFDYCIVDEATQILQAACLGPLFNSKRFILVGDPNQLPPIVRSEVVRKLGVESLFSQLDCSEATVELNTQYRMNREIVRLANILSYGGALTCASDEVSDSVLKLTNIEEALKGFNLNDLPMLRHLSSSSLEKSVLLINTDAINIVKAGDEQSKLINQVECAIVMFIVQHFVKAGLSEKQIGVITPFRDQVAFIQNRLKLSLHSEVEVNTVDQFQGRDKDAIIMSCVRNSTSDYSEGSILNDKRRVNVAITRARMKLIIIGKKSVLYAYEPMKLILSNLNPEQEIILEPNCFEVVSNYVNLI